MTTFVVLGRFDEAQQAARELQRIYPESPSAHFSNYLFAFFRRDQAAMDREVQWSRGKPEEAHFQLFVSWKVRKSERSRKGLAGPVSFATWFAGCCTDLLIVQ